MKNYLAVLTLMVPSAVMACGDLSDYNVAQVSFSHATVKKATERLMQDTPFKLAFNGETYKLISAKDVSGPLDQVLNALGEQFDVTYRKNGCVVTFSSKVSAVFSIKTGDSISEQLSVWAKNYGYTLAWEAEEYQAMAPLSLDKGFNETLDSLVTALKVNGVNLNVTIYDNRVIRIVGARNDL